MTLAFKEAKKAALRYMAQKDKPVSSHSSVQAHHSLPLRPHQALGNASVKSPETEPNYQPTESWRMSPSSDKNFPAVYSLCLSPGALGQVSLGMALGRDILLFIRRTSKPAPTPALSLLSPPCLQSRTGTHILKDSIGFERQTLERRPRKRL